MEKNIDFGYVADIYDYYTNVDFDIDFFKMLCKGHNNILELMCGTGRISIPLINEGFSPYLRRLFRGDAGYIP